MPAQMQANPPGTGSTPPSVNQDVFLAGRALAHASGKPAGHFLIPVCLRLEGAVDVESLARALNLVANRHDALRTAFPDVERLVRATVGAIFERMADPDGWARPSFSAIVQRSTDIELRVCDASDAAIAAMASGSSASFADTIREPILESRCPLIRATLFRGDRDRHLLLVVFHHLIADRWSVTLFLRELCAAYRAVVEGEAIPLAPAGSYRDFVAWQRAHLQEPTTRARLDDWRERYRSGLTEPWRLDEFRGLEATTPPAPAHHGVAAVSAGADLSRRVDEYCRARRVTRFIVCLAALAAQCHLQTRRTRMTFWSAFANRRPAYEGVLGWMSEGRALGVPIEPGVSFDGLVEEVRRIVFDALDHQDLPLAAIQHASYRRSAIAPSRTLHLTLEVSDAGLARPREMARGLVATRVRLPYNRTTVPNIVRLTIDPGEDLAVRCVFEEGKIAPAGVRTLLDQFQASIGRGVLAPDQPIEAIEPAFAAASRAHADPGARR